MDGRKELIEVSRSRTYIEPDQSIMPGVTHIGRLDFSSATKPLAPHTHGGAVEFCYLERGIAVFQSGKQKWRLNGGECFVSYADEVHGTGSHPLERMKLFWIGYRPEELCRWLAPEISGHELNRFSAAIGQSLPRTFGGSRKMGTAIGNAIEAYTGRSPFRKIELKTSLLNLFLHLAEKKGRLQIISPEIQAVIDYINSCNGEDCDTAFCSDLAGLSLSRFKIRFKSETGIPPGEFILRKKINYSCSLLSRGMSVLDTSLECGFSSSQYFATVFRKYMNKTPTQWLNCADRNIFLDQ